LITSAAFAVTIAVWNNRARWPFLFISLIFTYTTVLNIYERPEGIKIASFFIASIVTTSLISRAMRSTELRIKGVHLDAGAQALLAEDEDQEIHIVARKPGDDRVENLDRADQEMRYAHHLPDNERVYFFEVERSDASSFEETLQVHGERVGKHTVLRAPSPVVANSIAALLICLKERTGRLPHAYFTWTEGNPIWNISRFIFLGEGDVAPIAHEVLRRAIPNPRDRPFVHIS
jgi:hypothetical protein